MTFWLTFMSLLTICDRPWRFCRSAIWALCGHDGSLGSSHCHHVCELSSGHFTALWGEIRPPPHAVKERCFRTDSDAHTVWLWTQAATQTHVSAPLMTDHNLMRCVTSLRGCRVHSECVCVREGERERERLVCNQFNSNHCSLAKLDAVVVSYSNCVLYFCVLLPRGRQGGNNVFIYTSSIFIYVY